MPFSGPRLRLTESFEESPYMASTYCPADFPSLQSNLSDCIRMFVSWFDSPLVAWNPMFELNEVCFEMCWGMLRVYGPWRAIFLPFCFLTMTSQGADWWSCPCLRGAQGFEGFEARNGGVDPERGVPVRFGVQKLFSSECSSILYYIYNIMF